MKKKSYTPPAILSGSTFERRGILAGCCLTADGVGCSIKQVSSGFPPSQVDNCFNEAQQQVGPAGSNSDISS